MRCYLLSGEGGKHLRSVRNLWIACAQEFCDFLYEMKSFVSVMVNGKIANKDS